MTRAFRALLLEGMRKFARGGYQNEAMVQDWLGRLNAMLERELPDDDEMRDALAKTLHGIFDRDLRSGLSRRIGALEPYTVARVAPHLRAELDKRIFAGADLIRLHRRTAIDKTLQRFSGWATSVPPGGASSDNVRDAARDILKSAKQLKFEARRVAIDQGHKLSASVAHVVAEQHGAIAAIWHDRGENDHGYDARPKHLARGGKLFLIRNSWAVEQGLVRRGGADGYTDEIEQPAELPFCFPGSTPIQWANGVEVGYRRQYSGDLTEIITASGKTLRATPNHPVLTTKGFVACGQLQEGDDLIEIAEERIKRVVPKLANNQAEPTIAEIFSALLENRTLTHITGSRDQFHGDGAESNVDVVRAARPLTFDFVTSRLQRRNQFALAKPNLSRSALRAFSLFFFSGLTAATSFVRLFDPRFRPIGPTLLPSEIRGNLDGASYTADLMDHGRNEAPAYAAYLRDGFQRLSGFVAPTKIVSIKRFPWSGHVYNLQTTDGYYVANGIIAHNCSCYYEYITTLNDLPVEVLTAAGRIWVGGGGARNDSVHPSRAAVSVMRSPSVAQIAAGNYSMGHFRWNGLEITIETAKGGMRRGFGRDGEAWHVLMPAHYGYIRRTIGADDEQIDCYVGPNPDATMVWIVKQQDPDSGEFDEEKALIGFNHQGEALSTYTRGFSDGRGSQRIQSVLEMTISQFKAHTHAA